MPDASNRSMDAPRQKQAGLGLAIAVIVVAGVVAYADSFRGPFVFDDLRSIPDNPDIRSLWPLSRVLGSTQSATVIGRPLLSLSLAFSYLTSGDVVRGYHLFSLVIHLLCGVALLGVLRQAFQLPRMPADWQRGATLRAMVIATIWIVHPLASSTVLYMVQRAELLAGLMYLLTLYCLLRNATSDRPGRWQALAVICCAAGVATKETVATAPIAALLIDRILIADSWSDIFRRRGKLYAGLFASWILLAALVVSSHGRQGSAGFGSGMSPWQYLLTQFDAIVIYLRLCFWPSPLIFDYGFEVVRSPSEVGWQTGLVILLAVGTLVLMWRRPRAALPALLFFLILGPTSSVVPLISHTIAEHRMYLPLAAVILLAVMACESLLRMKVKPHQVQFRAQALLVVAALVIAGLCWGTYRRAGDYASALILWQDTAVKRPQNARALSNYGAELAKAGRTESARQQFEAAVRLQPPDILQSPNRVYFADAYDNLGNLARQMNAPAQSIDAYTQALRLSPERVQYYLSRAQARGLLRDYEGAVADCSSAIEKRPDYAEAYQQRAIARIQLKQYDRAWADIIQFERLGGQSHPLVLQQLSAAMPRPSPTAP